MSFSIVNCSFIIKYFLIFSTFDKFLLTKLISSLIHYLFDHENLYLKQLMQLNMVYHLHILMLVL